MIQDNHIQIVSSHSTAFPILAIPRPASLTREPEPL